MEIKDLWAFKSIARGSEVLLAELPIYGEVEVLLFPSSRWEYIREYRL